MRKIKEPEKTIVLKKRGRSAGLKNSKKKTVTKISKNDDKKRQYSIKNKNEIVKKQKKDIVLTKNQNEKTNIDIWKVNDTVYKIYSENKELLEKLAKNLGTNICATYSTGKGKDFAWDMFFDKKDLSYVNKICKKLS